MALGKSHVRALLGDLGRISKACCYSTLEHTHTVYVYIPYKQTKLFAKRFLQKNALNRIRKRGFLCILYIVYFTVLVHCHYINTAHCNSSKSEAYHLYELISWYTNWNGEYLNKSYEYILRTIYTIWHFPKFLCLQTWRDPFWSPPPSAPKALPTQIKIPKNINERFSQLTSATAQKNLPPTHFQNISLEFRYTEYSSFPQNLISLTPYSYIHNFFMALLA